MPTPPAPPAPEKKKKKTQVKSSGGAAPVKTKGTVRPLDAPGGNQQKLLLARWLQGSSDVILFDEPTRGIDVGARYEIYEWIRRLTADGKGVVVASSEIPELLGMADRILVVREGQLSGEILPGPDWTADRVLALAVPGETS